MLIADDDDAYSVIDDDDADDDNANAVIDGDDSDVNAVVDDDAKAVVDDANATTDDDDDVIVNHNEHNGKLKATPKQKKWIMMKAFRANTKQIEEKMY